MGRTALLPRDIRVYRWLHRYPPFPGLARRFGWMEWCAPFFICHLSRFNLLLTIGCKNVGDENGPLTPWESLTVDVSQYYKRYWNRFPRKPLTNSIILGFRRSCLACCIIACVWKIWGSWANAYHSHPLLRSTRPSRRPLRVYATNFCFLSDDWWGKITHWAVVYPSYRLTKGEWMLGPFRSPTFNAFGLETSWGRRPVHWSLWEAGYGIEGEWVGRVAECQVGFWKHTGACQGKMSGGKCAGR